MTHGSDYNNQDTQHSMDTVGSLASKSLIKSHSVYSKASNNWPRWVATKLWSIIIPNIIVTIQFVW